MKNVHILPTDKPSNITIRTKTNELMYSYKLFSSKNGKDINVNQNIYITFDEEIKEGDWFIEPINKSVLKLKDNADKLINSIFPTCKKIILTTDQDLIKDGVQAIEDDFLEWFVKNPSCEGVEIETDYKDSYGNWFTCDEEYWIYNNKSDFDFKYKIIIPKEEPKQETLEEELLQQIKFCLICKNDSQAIRLIEKYGFQKQEQMYSEE